MTLWIMPEFDREGRVVCQFWLQGGKHNVTPTDKNSVWRQSRLAPPPFGGRKGTTRFPEKKTA